MNAPISIILFSVPIEGSVIVSLISYVFFLADQKETRTIAQGSELFATTIART